MIYLEVIVWLILVAVIYLDERGEHEPQDRPGH